MEERDKLIESKDKLLASFNDVEGKCDGLLIQVLQLHMNMQFLLHLMKGSKLTSYHAMKGIIRDIKKLMNLENSCGNY